MKKVYISATSPLMFLTEVPLIATLILAILYTDSVSSPLGLYPLIIALSLGIIAIFLYLFRLVIISFDEVRMVGVFSSRDRAIINKGKTLIITLRKRGRIKVTLFGNDGQRPALDWASKDDYRPVDINLFRESAVGGRKALVRVLTYFGIADARARELAEAEVGVFEEEDFILSVESRDGERDYRILFKKTV